MLHRRFILAIFVALAAFWGAACSGDDSQFAGPGGQLAPQGGDVILRFDLQPRVPNFVVKFRITGVDAQGNVQFPTITVDKAPEVLLKNVSTLVKKFLIEYLDEDGNVVGTGEVGVEVVAGGTVTLIDPPFVSTVPPSSIAITPPSAVVDIGDSQQFVLTATLPDGTTFDAGSEATWTVADQVIASVDQTGLATGLSEGQTTVTATLGTLVAIADFRVNQDAFPDIAVIEVEPAEVFCPVNQPCQFQAILVDLQGNRTVGTNLVDWTLTNNAVGNITSTGLFTGISTGTTTVTATRDGVSGTGNVQVGDILISIAQQNSRSLGTFSFNGSNLALLGNSTLPDLPLTHALARNNLDLFVALNQTGIQYLRLQGGFYQNVGTLANLNLAGVDGIFVDPRGNRFYTWDADAKRFSSILFNTTTSSMTLTSQVTLNIANNYGFQLSGLAVGNQTFCHVAHFNGGNGQISQFCPTRIDESPGFFTFSGDVNAPGGFPLFRTNAVAGSLNFTNIRSVQCSDTTVFCLTRGAPIQLSAFTPAADGLLTAAAQTLSLTNASFPTGFTADPTGTLLPFTFLRNSAEFSTILSLQGGALVSLVEAPVGSTFPFDYSAIPRQLFAVTSSLQGERLAALNVTNLSPINSIFIDPAPCSIRSTR